MRTENNEKKRGQRTGVCSNGETGEEIDGDGELWRLERSDDDDDAGTVAKWETEAAIEYRGLAVEVRLRQSRATTNSIQGRVG